MHFGQAQLATIGSIKGELSNVEREVDALIETMNRSIEQAVQFLRRLDDDARGSPRPGGVARAVERRAPAAAIPDPARATAQRAAAAIADVAGEASPQRLALRAATSAGRMKARSACGLL